MSRHTALIRALGDHLRSRNVKSVIYFHTDHFEPWRSVGDTVPAVGNQIVDSVHNFVRATERIEFARRLSLFYKPHLNYALRREGDMKRADPEDLVGFLPRTEHEERCGRSAMGGLVSTSAHEIQLHIHHEYYTATTIHQDPAVIAWFASPLGRSLDGARLDLAIRLNRKIIQQETGQHPDRWFFVHGQWALNGSDDGSCVITNEIEILLRNGCCGDFTFPSGRPRTNPRIRAPYFCRPFDAPKGYDRAEAEPESAWGNRDAANAKFFIWAAPVAGKVCSLDYMSESSRRRLDHTERMARSLIDHSYAADGCLFIKTHAHSMHQYYFEHARAPVFPHEYPATQTLLSVIFDAAAGANIDVRFLTASEVYDLVLDAPAQPQVDLVTAYLDEPKSRIAGWFSAVAGWRRAVPVGREPS
jgi:hypothetical protein